MGPRGENISEEDAVIVRKLNKLLEQLHVPTRVKTVADIGAGVFVTLFEGLCGEQLPGIIRAPSTKEDEIHNCQTVINSLAGDVLHTSLTHIGGTDVIDANREAILNLIEIFSGLLEYMLNKIESDVSTDNEDDRYPDLTQDDLDVMTPDVIDRILESELRRERLMHDALGVKNNGPIAKWIEESSPSKKPHDDDDTTNDLIELGDVTGSPKKGAKDTTADLIEESKTIEKRLEEARKIRESQKFQTFTGPFSRSAPIPELLPYTGRESPEPAVRETDPDPDSAPENMARQVADTVPDRESEGLDQERERRAEIIRRLENDPRYKYLLPPTMAAPGDDDGDDSDKETFAELQELVEETAAMARAAVDASPSRARTMLQTLDTRHRPTAESSRPPARQPPCKSAPSPRSRVGRAEQKGRATTAKRASPSARRASPKATDRLSDSELTPSKAKRKVSFLVDRSLTDSSPSVDHGRPSPTRQLTAKSGTARRQQCCSFDGLYPDKENESYEDVLKKHYHEIVDDVLSDEDSPDQRGRGPSASRPKGLYSLADTKRLVEEEKRAGKKKIGFLQKIYREDLDELLDEADFQLYKTRATAKETEAEYKKKVLTGVKPTMLGTDKKKPACSVLKKKIHKSAPRVLSSKGKSTAPGSSVMNHQRTKPLTIQDDEDILPMLLDEFPHLHLSLHTWHELWRKGLTQIEQITRAHQEVRRKKSRAQNQLEEAEKRQEIMVGIMKKELEHGQRLKEIKERQASTIATKNKLHDRRIQSARSRHYYDEYQVRLRAKMLKRRTREEVIFKKLFKDGLEIQKERIKELRHYAREQRDSQASTQSNEIQSMENYYRDQFQMLAESISQEKQDLVVREKAQHKMLGQMKKDLRKKMETEIRQLQEHLVHDNDDAYFRQLDADRVVHDLKVAKYKVRV